MFSEKNFLWKTIRKPWKFDVYNKKGSFEVFYNLIYNELIFPRYFHAHFLSSVYLDVSCYFPGDAKISTEAITYVYTLASRLTFR